MPNAHLEPQYRIAGVNEPTGPISTNSTENLETKTKGESRTVSAHTEECGWHHRTYDIALEMKFPYSGKTAQKVQSDIDPQPFQVTALTYRVI